MAFGEAGLLGGGEHGISWLSWSTMSLPAFELLFRFGSYITECCSWLSDCESIWAAS